MERKKEIFSDYSRSVFAEVLAFSEKAEKFRIERMKSRRERLRRDGGKKK